MQPSWQLLTMWLSMLDSSQVNSSRLRWSPTAQSTGMLFSSWASLASDWWRRPGMFEHLRFYSNGFPLWCNVSIRFCCMMVSLMTTGQSRVYFQTSFVAFFCNFWATRGFPLVKKIIIVVVVVHNWCQFICIFSHKLRQHTDTQNRNVITYKATWSVTSF